MADLYIGDYGKVGDYRVPATNYEDHRVTFNFDGSKFHLTDDALYIGLHCTSIEGLSRSVKLTAPYSVLLVLHTKAYDYETGFGDNKKKVTQEPTPREKLLYTLLTSDDDAFNWEKNQGKGGLLMIGANANDAAILNGEGNLKKHARFAIEFDEDIKPFDMSSDSFRLDSIAGGSAGGKKGYNSKPAETESQRIEARIKAIEALVKIHKNLADDADPKAVEKAVKAALREPIFATHACIVLGLPIPSNLSHWEF
jgi:hypothetical protein